MPQQQGIVGDIPQVDIPQTQVDEQQLITEENMAKFSKTKEYKRLKEHIEQRIDFYQNYLPDGQPLQSKKDMEALGQTWMIANAVIGEFQGILQAYEMAGEAVKNARPKN